MTERRAFSIQLHTNEEEDDDYVSCTMEDVTPIHVHSTQRLDAMSSETALSDYVDQQFIHQFNEKMEQYRTSGIEPNHFYHDATTSATAQHLQYRSNSPLTLSCDHSRSNSDDHSESEDDGHLSHGSEPTFRNISFREIEKSIDKYYDDIDTTSCSNELDIMITYLKGQKNLYIQSKNVCHSKLNALFIPSLVVTSAITIFAPFIREYTWSGGVISGLNAFISLLILIANYYKLESSVEMFHHTANQYDKLETALEFVSSKLMFLHSDTEKNRLILEKIQELEKKISVIKEWNALFLPDEIRRMFPIICNINIFSFIKRMETYKKSLLIKFKDIKNEIRRILFLRMKREQQLVNMNSLDTQDQRLQDRLDFLLDIKEKIKEELMYYRNAYSHIDELFNKEINHAQSFNRCTWIMACNQSAFKHDAVSNPIIHRYLSFIFQP